MRRTIIVAVVALTGVVLAVPGQALAKRKVHFVATATGAAISATENVYKVHDSVFGDGAGVQTVNVTGTSGSDVTTTYYGNGTATSKDSFTLGTPDPMTGIASLTGSGNDISGTGKLKHIKSIYTFSGTFNTKTLVFTVTLTGKYSY